MIPGPWDAALEYLRAQPYWKKVQPAVALVSLYVSSVALAYQYIERQYGVSLSVPLFIRSYFFEQITVAFATLVAIVVVLRPGRRGAAAETPGRLARLVRTHAPTILRKGAVVLLVLAVGGAIFASLAPNRVSQIRIKFLDQPQIDQYAFVYLVYELNKLQRHWYFDVDFDVFNKDALTSTEGAKCEGDAAKSLCYAEVLAGRRPFIAITDSTLGADFFWQNRGTVSVVSTFDWNHYAPPSTYEFLLHSIIVQSILIHLSAHCGGLPAGAFVQGRVAYGDLFQSTPRRNAMKAVILAGHLSPNGERLLLNCFGVGYLTTCSRLLSLEWLNTARVRENLRKSFHITL